MPQITFAELVEKSKAFETKCTIEFPTEANRIGVIGKDDATRQVIENHARTTRPILAPEVEEFLGRFIEFKQTHGNDEVRNLYKEMNPDTLIDRLLLKRPLVFFTARDKYRLREGDEVGYGWPLNSSTDKISINEYISYDEICLSALLGVSVPTYFINSGSRDNEGEPGAADSYEPTGVFTALVGARFERPEVMESQFLVVNKRCTAEKGYGPTGDNAELKLWANLYGVSHFPTHEEAKAADPAKFMELDSGLLNIELYRKRMRLVIEPFLVDADDRAKAAGKQAFVHVVGLGLGAWMVHERQGELMVQVYADILTQRELKHLQCLNFSYFPSDCTSMAGVASGGTFTAKGNHPVQVLFNRRNPADRDVPENCLLVAMYPWDGNSFPGNEYWMELLSSSGDPAAACCSTIAELQNPYVNPNVCAANRFKYNK